MKHIALFCVNGMSSGLITQKIQEAADAEGYDAQVTSYPIGTAKEIAKENPDCALLSPQVRFQLAEIQKIMSCPVAALDIKVFGCMDGKGGLEQAKKLMGEE